MGFMPGPFEMMIICGIGLLLVGVPLIVVLVLVLLGKGLPGLMHFFGRSAGEFKKGMNNEDARDSNSPLKANPHHARHDRD